MGKNNKVTNNKVTKSQSAWEKVTGLKFQLCEKSYLLARGTGDGVILNGEKKS